jgi:hypothetical protein
MSQVHRQNWEKDDSDYHPSRKGAKMKTSSVSKSLHKQNSKPPSSIISWIQRWCILVWEIKPQKEIWFQVTQHEILSSPRWYTWQGRQKTINIKNLFHPNYHTLTKFDEDRTLPASASKIVTINYINGHGRLDVTFQSQMFACPGVILYYISFSNFWILSKKPVIGTCYWALTRIPVLITRTYKIQLSRHNLGVVLLLWLPPFGPERRITTRSSKQYSDSNLSNGASGHLWLIMH